MKASDLRKESKEELNTKLNSQRREQFKLRLQKSGSDLVKTDAFKRIRRNIARILTILNEKERKGKEGKDHA